MRGFVYILKSEKSDQYYVGSTSNLKVRFEFHNAGRVKATRYKRPYQLVFQQEFSSLKLAESIEDKIVEKKGLYRKNN